MPDKAQGWAKGTVQKAHSDGRTFDVLIDANSREPDGAVPAAAGATVTVNIDQPEYSGMDGLPLQNKVSCPNN